MPIGDLCIGIDPNDIKFGMAIQPNAIVVDAGSTDSL